MSISLIQSVFIIATLLILIGFKLICLTKSPQRGHLFAGIGLLIAVFATYTHPQVLSNYLLISLAMIVGGVIAFVFSSKIKLSDIPKMVTLYSGLGAGAVALITIIEISKLASLPEEAMSNSVNYAAIAATLIGSMSFSGALIAFARFQGLLKQPIQFPLHQWLNALVLVIAITFGIAIVLNGNQFEASFLLILVILALVLGVLNVLPLSDSDMPIIISLLNALTGLAVAFAGFVIALPVMMIVGMIVATACFILAIHIARAKNKSILSVMVGEQSSANDVNDLSASNLSEVSAADASMQMAFAKNVIVIPGFGMAASQAQAKLGDLHQQLKNKGVNVKFAVHPAAGRMPGHMNLLLNDAGIHYDDIYDLNTINDEFANTDVVLIIGGNDIANTSARNDQQSPIFGMQILNADQAKQVIVIKRSDGMGFSEIENPLFHNENTSMLYGDAHMVLTQVLNNIKSL